MNKNMKKHLWPLVSNPLKNMKVDWDVSSPMYGKIQVMFQSPPTRFTTFLSQTLCTQLNPTTQKWHLQTTAGRGGLHLLFFMGSWYTIWMKWWNGDIFFQRNRCHPLFPHAIFLIPRRFYTFLYPFHPQSIAIADITRGSATLFVVHQLLHRALLSQC